MSHKCVVYRGRENPATPSEIFFVLKGSELSTEHRCSRGEPMFLMFLSGNDSGISDIVPPAHMISMVRRLGRRFLRQILSLRYRIVRAAMKSMRLVCLFALFATPATLAQTNAAPFINQPLMPMNAAPGGSGFMLTVHRTRVGSR